MRTMALLTSSLFCALCVSASAAAQPQDYFRIRVIDQETGRGVPLVELRTVNNIRLYTDSAGIVAFDEPGLMNTRLFFHVGSHGYQFAKDGFGYAGTRLQVTPGGSAELRIERINIAKRLYRMTGAGIYRDSVLLGDKPPTEAPLLNGRVFGSDSVVNAVYRGRIYWFWGDTNKPDYPLGNFHVPGATSLLPASGGLEPDVGVNLRYFVGQNGFAKPTAQMPGKGPTWIGGLVTVNSADGQERLLAKYVKIKPPLEVYERGLIEFDDEQQQFGNRLPIPLDAPLQPTGHPLKVVEDGVEYVYFGHPYPRIRVPATAEAVRDLSRYEAWTCLKQGSREKSAELDRDSEGKLRYGWKPNTPAVVGKLRQRLIQQKKLNRNEGLIHLQDVATGKPVTAHGGSVYFNPYRQRWIAIILESFGTSLLGEIWYAEADTPLGPWVYARKVVTHDKYSFYNPKQHPMLDQDGGRTISFEGTYTNMFSGNSDQTPRYNYNQIMYRLDLDDPRLHLPVAVYDRNEDRAEGSPPYTTGDRLSPQERRGPIGWFALDRASDQSIPVLAEMNTGTGVTLVVGPAATGSRESGQPLFHALPADMSDPPATAVPLYEFVHESTQQRRYTTQQRLDLAGYGRTPAPVCLVWPTPIDQAFAN
jgi:hypothetical protein